MLREAVRENVAHMSPGPPRKLLPRYRYRRTALRALAVLVVPAALFVSVNAISTSSSSRPEVVVVAAKAPAVEAPVPIAPVSSFEPTLFQLAVKTVVLDPGHGGTDPGAESKAGLSEKFVTLDVAKRLRTLLEGEGLEVLMTREDDRTLSLKERAEFANERKGDLFVSIHLNSLPNQGRQGVETFVRGASSDPLVERLALEENRGSGYTQSDFKVLLEKVFVDAQRVESHRLGESVQKGLVRSLKPGDPALQDRGLKTAPFVVLLATEMPGVLAEVSCLSHEGEAVRLSKGEHRQQLAEALRAGLATYVDARNRPKTQDASRAPAAEKREGRAKRS